MWMVVLLCPGQHLPTLLYSVDSSFLHAQFLQLRSFRNLNSGFVQSTMVKRSSCSRQRPDRARKQHLRQFCGNLSLELIRMEELPCSVHENQWSWKTEAAGSRDQFLTKKSMSPITSIGKKLTWTNSRSFGLREGRQNEKGTNVSWTVKTNKRTPEIYLENFLMLRESQKHWIVSLILIDPQQQ